MKTVSISMGVGHTVLAMAALLSLGGCGGGSSESEASAAGPVADAGVAPGASVPNAGAPEVAKPDDESTQATLLTAPLPVVEGSKEIHFWRDSPVANGDGSTKERAVRELWQAQRAAKPGDVILVHARKSPSDYYNYFYFDSTFHGEPPQAATATSPKLPARFMTIRGVPDLAGNLPKVRGHGYTDSTGKVKGRNGAIILRKTSYLRFEKLDASAPGNSMDSTDLSGYATTAFDIEDSHHVHVVDSLAHSSGCHGIGAQRSDWLTFVGNTVWNNAKDNSANGGRMWCSGISNYNPVSSDTYPTEGSTRVWILNNKIHNNTNANANNAHVKHEDGNGIILDDYLWTQCIGHPSGSFKEKPCRPPYLAKTVVQNNVVYNNGGRGIHVYFTRNADVIGNTVAWNLRDENGPGYNLGEINLSNAAGVRVIGNVMYSGGEFVAPLIGTRHPLGIINCGAEQHLQAGFNAPRGEILVEGNLQYSRTWSSAVSAGAGPTAKIDSLHGSTLQCWDKDRPNQGLIKFSANRVVGEPGFARFGYDSTADFRLLANSLGRNRPAVGLNNTADHNGAWRGTSPTIGAYQNPAP